jgi:hypothetical protein
MPANVVRTPAEEKKWDKAKELAADQGHEGDWPYVTGIFKKMNPERFKEGSARRVLARYLAKKADGGYEEGQPDLSGWGWTPGAVQENVFHGMGSMMPPVRDGKGLAEVKPKIPKGTGVDAMLSRSKIPRFASSSEAEKNLIAALGDVSKAISRVSLLAREARHAQQNADKALKFLEMAEQVLGRDVARDLSLPSYRYGSRGRRE